MESKIFICRIPTPENKLYNYTISIEDNYENGLLSTDRFDLENLLTYDNEYLDYETNIFNIDDYNYVEISSCNYEKIDDEYGNENIYYVKDFKMLKQGNLIELGYSKKEDYFKFIYSKFEQNFREGLCTQDFITCLRIFESNVLSMYEKIFDKKINISDITTNVLFDFERIY